jgi:Reverse transcriptase (RNA-dependent DNA polymerase)
MSQPPGFVDSTYPSHMCHLNKALYGMRQSPRAWYHKLRETLLQLGFQPCTSDPSLFIYQHGSTIAFLMVYVDDIVLTDNNNTLLQQFVHLLDQKFIKKDLGQLHYFLRIEVQHTATGLLLTQSQYIYSILDQAKIQGAKTSSTPISTGKALSKFDGSSVQNTHLYRSIVGAL